MRKPIHIATVFLCLLAARCAFGQDIDIGIQQMDGQLVTGVANLDNNTFTFPERVFVRGLGPFNPSFGGPFGIDPGFFALADGSPFLPAGFGGLPSGAVMWDFLPMTIDGAESNLLYWDGIDDGADGFDPMDVDFAPAVDTQFNFFAAGAGSGSASAAGESTIVTGGTIATGPTIHTHPLFTVTPNNGSSTIPEGYYLVALQARLDGLETSDPFFLAFHTTTIDANSQSTVHAWTTDNIDSLLGLEGIDGDFNNDGFVNAADYVVWRDGASPDDTVAGYDEWAANFGVNVSSVEAATTFSLSTTVPVPEPASALLALVAGLGLIGQRRQRPA